MLESVQVYDQYKQWDQEQKLQRLVSRGVVTPTQFRFYTIYADYGKEIRSRFKTRATVVCNLCEKYKVSHVTIYTAIRFMEQSL